MRRILAGLLAVVLFVASVEETRLCVYASKQDEIEEDVQDHAAEEFLEEEDSLAGTSQEDELSGDGTAVLTEEGEGAEEPEEIEEPQEPEEPNIADEYGEQAADTGGEEYLTDDTQGYTLTEVQVDPGSYHADFLMISNKGFEPYILYTDNESAASRFFPGVAYVEDSDIQGTDFYCARMSYRIEYMEESSEVTGRLEAEGGLTPKTTYYYRIVYRSGSTYYFLTRPMQFETKNAAESTAVSVHGLQIEDAGYCNVRVIWNVDNPDQEYMVSTDLRYVKGGTDEYTTPGIQFRTDDSMDEIPGKYYAELYTNGNMLKAQAEATVYTGSPGQATRVVSEELTVSPIPWEDTDVHVDVKGNINTMNVMAAVSPWNEIDRGTIHLYFYYRASGEEDWKYAFANIYSGSASIQIEDLAENTEYQYYYELFGRRYGSKEEPFTVSTGEQAVYEDSQFPDEVFRAYIRRQAGIADGEPITGTKLEKLTQLRNMTSEVPGVIKSLEGIQYASGLTSISLYGHAIEDAKGLEGLSALKEIDLSENELAVLPDLSRLTALIEADFTGNKITSDTITEDRMPAYFLRGNPSWLPYTAKRQYRSVKTPDRAEILARYAQLIWNQDLKTTYKETPSLEEPYAPGRLSDETLDNVLRMMNFARYTAGVPDNVELDEAYIEYAQAGTLVNAVNHVMTHYPDKPAGFPEDLFQKGYIGCSSSNLGSGYSNLPDAMLRGWLNDSDKSNIDRAGHRRWVLNPLMSATGFGVTGRYLSMYALDNGELEWHEGTYISDFVAWPARNMPIEFMGTDYAWSISLGNDYRLEEAQDITVTMKDANSGKSWTFQKASSSWDSNYLSVSEDNYGRMPCIIFRPQKGSITYKAGSRYEISVTGLKDRFGNDQPLQYTVDLFALSGSVVEASKVTLDRAVMRMQPGESRTLTASVRPADVTNPAVTWESDHPEVASVDTKGTVTALSYGEAIITAAAHNGKSASCKVKVSEVSVSLNMETCMLEAGETKQLKAYFSPYMPELQTELVWSSDAPSVVSVDENGLVTGLAKGRAAVTASVGGQSEETGRKTEAKCIVEVKETAVPDIYPDAEHLFALTNTQEKLSDISLAAYRGWEWEYGDTALQPFAGETKKEFPAVYHKEGYADYRTVLPVSISALTGISILADSPGMKTGDISNVQIRWNMTGSEKVMLRYVDRLVFSSSDPSVLSVEGKTDASAVLKAGRAGKAVVKAEITLGKKTFKAQQTITVTDAATLGVKIETSGNFETAKENEEYRGRLEDKEGFFRVAVSAGGLMIKSADSKVAAVGKIVQESAGIFRVPIVMKASGMAKITITANDAAKTSKSIWLKVTDPAPNISEETVTVNLFQTTGTTFFIYPNAGYTVESVKLTDNSFTLAQGVQANSYVMKAKEGTTAGTYKIEVDAVVEGKVYTLPLTVKVTEQAPKYRIVQSGKAKLFYQDLGAPQLTVVSDEKVENLTLEGCDFLLSKGEENNYIISARTDHGLAASCNKKGRLTVKFEGYRSVSASYTVKTDAKELKLSLNHKTVILYPKAGLYYAWLEVNCGKKRQNLADVESIRLLHADGCSLSKEGDRLFLDGSGLTDAEELKAEIELKGSSWTKAVRFPCNIKVNLGSPSIKLQDTSLTLNTNAASYDAASTEILWKGADAFSSDIKIMVEGADAKTQEVIEEGIVFETAGNKVTARLNNRPVMPGSYKFKVTAQTGNKDVISAPLTVKVVNTDLAEAVRLSAKGTIDVLNRTNSFVTITPKIKALNGTIADGEVRLLGKDAHLFYAKAVNGQVSVYAREDAALITKYPYSIKLMPVLENADGQTMQVITKELRIRLKQGKPKLALSPRSAAFFKGAYNSVQLKISSSLKGAPAPELMDLRLLNGANIFTYNYDSFAASGTLTLPEKSTAVKGKKYNLRFQVHFKGQADNEKTTVIKYSVKVK